MICKVWKLSEIFPELGDTAATLTVYCPDVSPEIDPQRKRATVLICPGGGYAFCSFREAEPVALQFVGAGYNALVLSYSVAPARYPQALLESAASMAFIRRHSNEFHADPGRVAVCGFSAGGHLAASTGILWNEPVLAKALSLSEKEARPDAMILGYPVITSGEKAHRGSFECLLGTDAPVALIESQSLENRVAHDTSPAFIWHTANDDCVPVENSLLLAGALSRCKVPFELHIFPSGVHGLSLCDRRTGTGGNLDNPSAGQWVSLCLAWLNNVFSI